MRLLIALALMAACNEPKAMLYQVPDNDRPAGRTGAVVIHFRTIGPDAIGQDAIRTRPSSDR